MSDGGDGRTEWERQIDRTLSDLLREVEELRARVAALELTLTRVRTAIGRHGEPGAAGPPEGDGDERAE
jgi:hypothetical protein